MLCVSYVVLACGDPDRNVVRIRGAGTQLFNTYVDPSIQRISTLRTEVGNAAWKCVDGLDVIYQRDAFTESVASELHLFTMPGFWPTNAEISPAQFTQLLAQSNPRLIPNVVVIPYPSGGTDPTLPVTVTLASNMFWGQLGPDLSSGLLPSVTSCSPVSSPQTTHETGSIAAFAVFQRGACSKMTALNTVLSQVTTQLFSSFSNGVGNAKQNYNEAISFIARPGLLDPEASQFDPNDPYDVRGGFLLKFSFSGDHAFTTNEVSAKYHYFFGLRGGVVAIDEFVSHGVNANGLYDWAFKNSIRAGLETTLPQTFFSAAQAKQMRPLPGASPACNTVSDCSIAAALLSAVINPSTLAQAGIPNAAAADVRGLQCAVGLDSACAQAGLSSQFNDRWVCAPPNQGQPAVCQYVVPIKRLNVFEDELETVFFDGPEVHNGAFALVVAGGNAARQELCTTTPGTATFTRSFTLAGTGSAH
jgi:hypothetical protein